MNGDSLAAAENTYIGLGSNMGPCQANLHEAADRMQSSGIKLLRASSIYESEPVGLPGQPLFLNAVLEVRSPFEPRQLLQNLKKIEAEMGRLPGRRWGPRPIDLDILLFGRRRLRQTDLVIPHPLMLQRAFVLIPLQEIAPGVNIVEGLTPLQALEALQDVSGVRKRYSWRCQHA